MITSSKIFKLTLCIDNVVIFWKIKYLPIPQNDVKLKCLNKLSVP